MCRWSHHQAGAAGGLLREVELVGVVLQPHSTCSTAQACAHSYQLSRGSLTLLCTLVFCLGTPTTLLRVLAHIQLKMLCTVLVNLLTNLKRLLVEGGLLVY